MTRLAFDLGGLERTSRSTGNAAADRRPGREARRDTFAERPAVGLRARCGRRLDQLQTVRKYYDFTDVDTDRYTIDGVPAPGHALRPASSRSSRTRSATGWVNQRIIYTHGIGVAMVPVNEVDAARASRSLLIGNLPPASIERRADDHPAADLLRRAAVARTSSTGAQQDEFDYPTGESDTGGLDRDRRRAGRARPGSSSTTR